MAKNYPKFNTAQEVMDHICENELSDTERQYYLQKLKLAGAGYHVTSACGNKEK